MQTTSISERDNPSHMQIADHRLVHFPYNYVAFVEYSRVEKDFMTFKNLNGVNKNKPFYSRLEWYFRKSYRAPIIYLWK